MSQASEHAGAFCIARWQAWAPGVQTADDWIGWLAGETPEGPQAPPDASQVPARLRRRLDLLGRMALHTAWPCVAGLPQVQSVFASRDGSLPRTLEILTALARDEPVSPATFSVAVHNSTAGLYSMARADRSATTAIGAGADTLVMGLLEASCLIAAGTHPVLLCYADQALPPPYDHVPGHGAPHGSFSISLLLETASTEREYFRLTPSIQTTAERPEAALLRLLLEHSAQALIGSEQCWRLQRHTDAAQT